MSQEFPLLVGIMVLLVMVVWWLAHIANILHALEAS